MRRPGLWRPGLWRLAIWLPVALLALAAPLSLTGFWLQTGLFVTATAIGAIGLTLLVGVTGQLSLGHAFFVAVGAYGYAYLAGALTPPLAAVSAVALAGTAGALFSPIAGRLRGIYLGLASLGLVFLGQHALQNATPVTGGFNGRDAEPFWLFGFSFTATDPDLVVLGVPYGALERLWYLGLLLLTLAWWYARNLLRGRPGRALAAVRDGEIPAAVMGVDVRRYKAAAFTVSSAYAGLAGVLLALVYGRIVPDSFGLLMSVDFLAVVIIGGLGSVAGAVAGALVVTALPLVLGYYSHALPLLAQPGEGGVGAAEAARLLYGVAIVVVLLFAPGGLAQLCRRVLAPAAPISAADAPRPPTDAPLQPVRSSS